MELNLKKEKKCHAPRQRIWFSQSPFPEAALHPYTINFQENKLHYEAAQVSW